MTTTAGQWTTDKLNQLLVDAGQAIDANNGRCELIEDVLCRVTTLVCNLLDAREQEDRPEFPEQLCLRCGHCLNDLSVCDNCRTRGDRRAPQREYPEVYDDGTVGTE